MNKNDYLSKYKLYFDLSNPKNNEINCEDKNNIIRVDYSSINNHGVFANIDILKNNIITYYPAHYIYKLNNYSIYNINLEPPSNYKDYRFDLDIIEDIAIIGHPYITGNMNWVGNKINDGYKHNYKINNKKKRNKYNKKTKECNNALFIVNKNNIVEVVATKNIKKDDEILVSYRFNYWLRFNTNF